jgi:hypothetical protein
MDARAVLAVTYPHINLIRRMETRHQESVIKKASSGKRHQESVIRKASSGKRHQESTTRNPSS